VNLGILADNENAQGRGAKTKAETKQRYCRVA